MCSAQAWPGEIYRVWTKLDTRLETRLDARLDAGLDLGRFG